MKTHAEILRTAALERLSITRVGVSPHTSWFSCNAVCPPEWCEGYTTEAGQARKWYTENILGGTFPDWKIGEDCGDESQNVRFMLLMFASYLAEAEGL